MAIQVSGTQVIGNSRELTNIASVDSTTAAAITAAGVGAGGTAPTSGTTYEVVFPYTAPSTAGLNYYGNAYISEPSGTLITSADGFNLGLIGLTAGTIKMRANLRTLSGSNPVYFRVTKNGTQVGEAVTTDNTVQNLDVDVTFAANDRIQCQIRVTTYGQDSKIYSVKGLSGTNATGCMIVGQ